MKRILFLIMLAGSSCSEEATKRLDDDLTAIPEDLGGIYLGYFVGPAGTQAVLSKDGSVLTYRLPEGYVYAGIGENGELITLNSGCYQCTSSCSKGCDVVRLGDMVGCSACDENSPGSKVCTGSPCDVMYQLEQAGLVNLKTGISVINHIDSVKDLRHDLPSWEVLEKIEAVQQELNHFVEEVWGNNFNAENGKWVVVNFFGAAARFLVPADYAASARTVEAEGTSCSCKQGDGCTYEAIYRMGIKIGEICHSNGCHICQMIFQ